VFIKNIHCPLRVVLSRFEGGKRVEIFTNFLDKDENATFACVCYLLHVSCRVRYHVAD